MNKSELQDAIRPIATELTKIDPNSNWQINFTGECDWFQTIVNEGTSEAIGFRYDSAKKKFSISANWPNGADNQSLAPIRGEEFRFGCSPEKSPAVIARAIVKQILTDFRPKLAEALQYELERISAISARKTLAIKTCEILGIPYNPQDSKHGYPLVRLPYNHCTGIADLEIEIAGKDDFKFSLESTDSNLSLELITVIKLWSESHLIELLPKRTVADVFFHLIEKEVGEAALLDFSIKWWKRDIMGEIPDEPGEVIRIFGENASQVKGGFNA
jgi:hypothetical protein